MEKVQLSSFGRLLNGQQDALTGYQLSQVEITDEAVLAQSEQRFHPVAIPSGDVEDMVGGVVFEITYDELLRADEYEVDDYARVLATLASGKKAWIYFERICAIKPVVSLRF